MLHRECLTPIKQKRWCPVHDVEVSSEDLVRGWEIVKGQFVPIEDEVGRDGSSGDGAAASVVEADEARDGHALRRSGHVHVEEPRASDEVGRDIDWRGPPCGEGAWDAGAVVWCAL